MIAELRRVGVARAVTAALLAAAVTSACAAGQQAQTAAQKPTLDGTYASVGHIDLRGLAIEAPTGKPFYSPGSNATIKLVIVNSGSKPDTLTSVTSPIATGWGAFATIADATAAEAAASASSTPAAPTSTAATSTAATSSAPRKHHRSSASAGGSSSSSAGASSSSAAATPTAPPAPTPKTRVSIASGSRVSWGVPVATGTLLLMHIKKRLYPGSTVPITFTFADAGSVTVPVPVALTAEPGSSTVPAPAATSSIPA